MNFCENDNYIGFKSLFFSMLLFFMMVFQQQFEHVKILLLIAMLLLSFHDIFKKKCRIKKYILFCFLLWQIFYLIYIIYSYYRGNPGTFATIRVELIYSIIYLFIISNIYRREQLGFLNTIFLISNILIIIIIFFCLANSLICEDLFKQFNSFFGFMYGIHGFMIETSTYNIDALFFTIPFTFYNYICLNDESKLSKVSFYLSLMYFFISGRVAMQILFIVSLCFCYLFSKKEYVKNIFEKYKNKICFKIIFVFLMLLIFCTAFIFFYVLIIGDSIRVNQFYALMNDLYKHPLFGNGVGFVSSIIRNPDIPWAYELVYIKLLASFGVIGFAFYLLILYLMTLNLIKKDKTLILYVFPTVIVFIANFSNPYLTRFDNMWIYFISLIAYNVILNDKDLEKGGVLYD